jgi:hypothetical protein
MPKPLKYFVSVILLFCFCFNAILGAFAQNIDVSKRLLAKRNELEETLTARRDYVNKNFRAAGITQKDRNIHIADIEATLAKQLFDHESRLKNSSVKRAEEIRQILLNKDGDYQKSEPLNFKDFINDEKLNEEISQLKTGFLRKIESGYRAAQAKISEAENNYRSLNYSEDEISLWKKENNEYITSLRKEAKTRLESAVKTELKRLHKNYLQEWEEQHSDKNIFKTLQNLARDLINTYKSNPKDVLPYMLELAPLLTAVKFGEAGVFTAEDKILLREIFTDKLNNPQKDCLEDRKHLDERWEKTLDACDTEINAIAMLGVIGGSNKADTDAIMNFLFKKLSDEDKVLILMTSISSLLNMKAYGEISRILSYAEKKENKHINILSIFDIITASVYVSGMAGEKGIKDYYGDFSTNFRIQKEDKDGNIISTNAWTEIALMLAQEGSKESLALLREHGVQKCDVGEGNAPGKFLLQSSAVMPFLAGALISGKSGADKYEGGYKSPRPLKPATLEDILVKQKRKVTQTDRDFISGRLVPKNSFEEFVFRQGLDIENFLALSIINRLMKDLSFEEEHYIDSNLHKRYGGNISGRYNSFALLKPEDEKIKTAELGKLNSKYIAANIVDIGVSIYFMKDLPRLGIGFVRGAGKFLKTVRISLYNAIKTIRAGVAPAKFTHVQNNSKAILETVIKNTKFNVKTSAFHMDLNKIYSETSWQEEKVLKIMEARRAVEPVLADAAKTAEWNYAWDTHQRSRISKLVLKNNYGKVLAKTAETELKTKLAVSKEAISIFQKSLRQDKSLANIAPVAVRDLTFRKPILLLNEGFNELKEGSEILKIIQSGQESEYITKMPINFNFADKIYGINMKKLQEIVLYKNGDSRYWMSFLTKENNSSLRVIDPANFKIAINSQSIPLISTSFYSASLGSSVFKGLKFVPENLSEILAKSTIKQDGIVKFLQYKIHVLNQYLKEEGLAKGLKSLTEAAKKDYKLSEFHVYDFFGNKINKFKIKTAVDLKGKIKFMLDETGVIRPALKGSGAEINGYFTLPKETLGLLGGINKPSFLNINATIKSSKNKMALTMFLSAVNLSASSAGLTGAIDDTYTKDELSDFWKIIISTALPAAASFASPAFSRFTRKVGAVNVLGYSFLTAAGAFIIPITSNLFGDGPKGFNGFGEVSPGNKPHWWPLMVVAPLAGLATALSKSSMNMIINSVDKKGALLTISIAYKNLFTPAVLLVPVLVNTLGNQYTTDLKGNIIKKPILDPFINYTLLTGVSLGSFVLLRSLNLPSEIGKTQAASRAILSAKEKFTIFSSNASIIGGGINFIASEASTLNGYAYKQMNREWEKSSSLMSLRPDLRYLSTISVMMLPAVLSRPLYKPIFKALGGIENSAAHYRFLLLNTGLSTAGTIILKKNDDNLPMFLLGSGLASFGYANNYAILYKLGIKKLQFRGFGKAVTNNFQMNFGSVLGAGAVGGLSLSTYSASVKDNFSPEEQRMNKHLKKGLWIPMAFNGAGMGFTGLSLTRSGVSLPGIGGLLPPRAAGISLGLLYGTAAYKRYDFFRHNNSGLIKNYPPFDESGGNLMEKIRDILTPAEINYNINPFFPRKNWNNKLENYKPEILEQSGGRL